MKIKKELVQMYSFEVVNNSLLWSFFMKCFWLRPCAYLGGWKWIISKRAHGISKILFILGSNKCLACLERIKSYTWSFGHSNPDPSSVSSQNWVFRPYLKKSFTLTVKAKWAILQEKKAMQFLVKRQWPNIKIFVQKLRGRFSF